MDAGEVLRQTSAVIGRPVTLWEVTGPHQAVPRATSSAAAPAPFDLDSTLLRWNVPIPVGSLWIAAPTADVWIVAPVRSRPSAPPPGGRERRSRERLALELAGLALRNIDALTTSGPAGVMVHEASNPLSAARAGLQLAMESIGRWVDLAADRRLALLDDLGEVLEDIDRTSEYLRVMKESGRSGALTARAERGGRFDAVRVIRSCLTLERRLLRDRGIELDFATSLESVFLRGDSNALFDLLVNVVRNAAGTSPGAGRTTAVRVRLETKGKELVLAVHGHGAPADVAKLRAVAESAFNGSFTVETQPLPGGETSLTIALPLPAQREADRLDG